MLAKVVVIEGPDKVGKETQSNMLAHSLRLQGDRVSLVEIPFNDHFTYTVIYKMLRSGSAKRWPNVFQFIQFLNKLIFQWTVLLVLRFVCDIVVLDRWSLSSIVYGDATGVNKTFNRILFWLLLKPHVTCVLHGPSFVRKSVDDVYEKDTDLQIAVRTGYYDWVQEHPFDHDLIDNQGSHDDVHERVLDVVLTEIQESYEI